MPLQKIDHITRKVFDTLKKRATHTSHHKEDLDIFLLTKLTENSMRVLKENAKDKKTQEIYQKLSEMRDHGHSLQQFILWLNIDKKILAGRFFYKFGFPFLSTPIMNAAYTTLKKNKLSNTSPQEKKKTLIYLDSIYETLGKTKQQKDILNQLITLDQDNKEKWLNKKNGILLKPKQKNTTFIKTSYEDTWSKSGDIISQALDNGETPLSIVLRHTLPGLPRSTSFSPITSAVAGTFIEKHKIQPTSLGRHACSVGVTESNYNLISRINPPEFISHFVTEKTTNIIELGSGWGRNLFMLHYLLGKQSSSITYHALEYTSAGQAITQKLGSAISDINLKTRSFDYFAPDFDFLPDTTGDLLFFSHFSIEQVPYLGKILFEELLKLKKQFTVIHFEPVGWQKDKILVQKRKDHDEKFFETLAEQRLKNIYDEDSVLAHCALTSWQQGYNIDLLETLKELENKKQIEITDIIYNYAPPHEYHNPGTLIVWRPL